MIAMVNESNEICQNLGRYNYHYEPFIRTEVLPDGRKVPKVCCRAFPDRDKDFNVELTFDQFEDKIFMIRDKWEAFQYDLEEGGNIAPELDVDEHEGEIFGMVVTNDWHLIGNVYVFMDSLANLLDTVKDESPIIDTKGDTKGSLTYSLQPKVYDEDGQLMNLMLVDSVNELLGRNLTVELGIHEAKEIPEKWTTLNYASYQWVDEQARMFETDKHKVPTKNPKFNYKASHDMYVSNYIVDNLADSTLIVSVWGKLSQ